ncbi:MAG: ArsR/SmtB family transcription factor [Candidatus Dormibacteria bacterium]
MCCSPLGGRQLSRVQATQLARMLKVMAGPSRLRLISTIASCPVGASCACELTTLLELSQPTISHHISVLLRAGLIERGARHRSRRGHPPRPEVHVLPYRPRSILRGGRGLDAARGRSLLWVRDVAAGPSAEAFPGRPCGRYKVGEQATLAGHEWSTSIGTSSLLGRRHCCDQDPCSRTSHGESPAAMGAARLSPTTPRLGQRQPGGHDDRRPGPALLLTGAGPAAIGAIAGSAIPLGLALTHLWQLGVLAAAFVWLVVLRRNVVVGLIGAAMVGVVLSLVGLSVSS